MRNSLRAAIACALVSSLVAGYSDAAAIASDSATAAPKARAAEDTLTSPQTYDEQQPAAAAASPQPPKTLQQIVVTGVPTVNGVTRHEASFQVTTLDHADIKQALVINTASLLDSSPGVYTEASGGIGGGNNVEVAGFPGGTGPAWVTFQLQGMPVWALYNNANVGNIADALIQVDDSVAGLQMVQGGSAVLVANGQPGVTANFQLRQGTPTPSGNIGVTAYSVGGAKLHGFLGGPVGNTGWRASIGGYWLRTNGVRHAGYPADEGYQLTATLSKSFDNSSVMFYARRLKQNDQFITDTPIGTTGAGRFNSTPGFSALYDTYNSVYNRYLYLASAACNDPGCVPAGQVYDMQKGRGAAMSLIGASYQYFGDRLSVSNDFQAMRAIAPEFGLFSTPQNPVPLSDFVAAQAKMLGLGADDYTYSAHLTTSQPWSPAQDITTQTPSMQMNRPDQVSDQFKFGYDFGNGNTLSGGVYVASMGMSRFTLNAPYRILLQNTPKAAPVVVDLTTSDGRLLPITDTQGVYTSKAGLAPGGNNLEHWRQTQAAAFLADTWKLGRWVLTGGVRVTRVHVKGSYHLNENVDLDGDPDTVYNNYGQIFLPQTRSLNYTNTVPTGMAGATYLLSDRSSVYANGSYGMSANNFETVRNIPGVANSVRHIHDFRVGYKYDSDRVFFAVQAYRRMFFGSAGVFLLADGSTIVNTGGGSSANGINTQVSAHITKQLEINFMADYVDSSIVDNSCHEFVSQSGQASCTDNNGHRMARQPNFQYSLTPRYTVDTSFGSLAFWVAFRHVGLRYAQAANDFSLGMYNTVGVGAQAEVGKHLDVTFTGTNVTNRIGVTEGNSRIFAGAQDAGGVVLARSIPGHQYMLDINYKF
jgi:hypothetical protein